MTAAERGPIGNPSGDPQADYRQLYDRWETEGWSAGRIGLEQDRAHWERTLGGPDRERVARLLSVVAVAAHGPDALVPLVDAVPFEEQQVFLTTEVVDEARQRVFFDRYAAEVLRARFPDPPPALEKLLLRTLPALMGRLSRDRRDDAALIEAIVLYPVLVQGSLRLPAIRRESARLTSAGVLPGLREGLAATARDLDRHAAFGASFLTAQVAVDPAARAGVEAAVERLLPEVVQALGTLGEPGDAIEGLRGALRAWLRTIGCEMPGLRREQVT
ncbi:MAG: hypothetical protein M3345_02325 [Actinomycetota bacterium]|nr:hypothetical protein [Actinomycetota bacterium]